MTFDVATGWNTDRGAIPNRVGVLVEVELRDGALVKTVVELGANDVHQLRGVPIASVRRWRFR